MVSPRVEEYLDERDSHGDDKKDGLDEPIVLPVRE
jgi:hypothetical protein